MTLHLVEEPNLTDTTVFSLLITSRELYRARACIADACLDAERFVACVSV
jgi:hypothetical protein